MRTNIHGRTKKERTKYWVKMRGKSEKIINIGRTKIGIYVENHVFYKIFGYISEIAYF